MAKKETEIRVFSSKRYFEDKTIDKKNVFCRMHGDYLNGAHIEFDKNHIEAFISKPKMWVQRKWTVLLEDWQKGVR